MVNYYRLPIRAVKSSIRPRPFAVCDRCGFLYNRDDLNKQVIWAGSRIETLNLYVCHSCYDKPQEGLRTLLIPNDPIPIDTPRPEPYSIEMNSTAPSSHFVSPI